MAIILPENPLDRFLNFNKKLDQTLTNLDNLGDLYSHLWFREVELGRLNRHQQEVFREELIQHGQLCLSLLHHPLIVSLQEARTKAQLDTSHVQKLEVPSGVWQHYKGDYYQVIGAAISSDFDGQGVIYHEVGEPDTKYFVSLLKWYSKIEHEHKTVSRFVKIRE